MYYKSTPMYEIKAMAEKSLKVAIKKKLDYSPVIITSNKISVSWWGESWCENLESYAVLMNRLPRGKSYVKNGCVIDLKIGEGEVRGVVQGSHKKPYNILIEISKLKKEKWEKILELCKARINSLDDLSKGVFPKELAFIFKDKAYGLFPTPKEIAFNCTCQDGAYLCKHVAAVLYAVGSKLDNDPLLFFKLRGLNSNELIRKTLSENINTIIENVSKKDERIISDDEVAILFKI